MTRAKIDIRVSPGSLRRYKDAASNRGMTLSSWIRDLANREIERDGDEAPKVAAYAPMSSVSIWFLRARRARWAVVVWTNCGRQWRGRVKAACAGHLEIFVSSRDAVAIPYTAVESFMRVEE